MAHVTCKSLKCNWFLLLCLTMHNCIYFESLSDFDLIQATEDNTTKSTKVRSIVCSDCDGNGKWKCWVLISSYYDLL